MNPFRYIAGKLHARVAKRERAAIAHRESLTLSDLIPSEWKRSLLDPTDFYLNATEYFDRFLPVQYQEHRKYFTQEGRGFGEDAFHTLWFLLFTEFHPTSFLEIGVYRGQTLSLASMLARSLEINCIVQGISPFTSAGDKVSKYRKDVNYYEDTLNNFSHFGLPAPALLKAYSTDLEAERVISSRQWHMIYIDGNHDYPVARSDWDLCSQNLAPNGIIVLDDSGLGTAYRPPAFATAGHPGPSQLANEVNSPTFQEILQVGHNRVFQKIG